MVLDRLVVMVVDGLRWQEIFQGPEESRLSSASAARFGSSGVRGLLPNLTRIAKERGFLVGGQHSRLAISSPSTVSLPSYAELFGGRQPKCSNNACPNVEETTLLDEWLNQSPEASLGIISSWSAIPRVAARDIDPVFVSAGRSHNRRFRSWLGDAQTRELCQLGAVARPAPGVDDYRPDVHTASLALRVLEAQAPDFLFLGLGDTDEYAHQNNYEQYLEAISYSDKVLGQIDHWLQQRERAGERTLFVVTTDHGRARNFTDHGGHPEAARVWALFSGSVVKPRGEPELPAAKLADLAPTFRSLLGLVPDLERNAGRSLVAVLDGNMGASESGESLELARY